MQSGVKNKKFIWEQLIDNNFDILGSSITDGERTSFSYALLHTSEVAKRDYIR